jgi:hypothetical protein
MEAWDARGGLVSPAKQAQEHLETETAMLGRALAKQLRPGVGFCLVLYNFGAEGNMAYLANGERESVIKLLRELCDKIEVKP